MVPNQFHVGRAKPSVLLTEGGGVMDMGCRGGLGFSFIVVSVDFSVVGLGVMNFRS